MKQTAVEWLVEQIKDYDFAPLNTKDYEIIIPIGILESKVEQAKAMEKEQIIDTYWASYNEGKYSTDKTADEYYKKTFKQE
jgi:hypothetical protein